MEGFKTKFNCFISFGSQWFDTTPDADDDSGEISIPTVCLDGDFTCEELKGILKQMKVHVKTFNDKGKNASES